MGFKGSYKGSFKGICQGDEGYLKGKYRVTAKDSCKAFFTRVTLRVQGLGEFAQGFLGFYSFWRLDGV